MKPVALDLRGLQPGFKAHFGRGLGRICQGLADHLPQAAGDLPLVGLVQANLDQPGPEHLAGRPRWALPQPLPRVRGAVRLLGQEAIVPLWLRGRVSLVHFIAHLDAPAFGGLPAVVTVPDLIMARGLGTLAGGGPHRRLLRALERRAVRRARRVAAISEYTAREVVDYLGVSPERVRVVPLAAAEDFRPVRDPAVLAEARRRYNLAERFLLSVGGFDPRKNLPRLVRAFGRLAAAGAGDCRLYLAGSTADQGQVAPTLAAIREAGLEERVSLLGFVPDEDLPALYSLAQGLVFPSLYEGFGLPALEALACGCPVLAARATSLPEIVGPAGIYFDPQDEAGMAETMARFLASPELKSRLSRMGPDQAGLFSWPRSARLTVEIYAEALGEAG